MFWPIIVVLLCNILPLYGTVVAHLATHYYIIFMLQGADSKDERTVSQLPILTCPVCRTFAHAYRRDIRMHIEKNHVRIVISNLTLNFTSPVIFNWDTFKIYWMYTVTCITIYSYIAVLTRKFYFCCSESLPPVLKYLTIYVHAL